MYVWLVTKSRRLEEDKSRFVLFCFVSKTCWLKTAQQSEGLSSFGDKYCEPFVPMLGSKSCCKLGAMWSHCEWRRTPGYCILKKKTAHNRVLISRPLVRYFAIL